MKPQAGLARRRHSRIDIDGGHGAQDLTDGHYVRIRDVSVGGLQTETPRETVPGAMHTFRVVLRDGRSCMVRATAMHCRAVPGGRHGFLVGWKAAADPVTAAAIAQLIEEVTTITQSEVDPP